jgi:arsenate reductase
VTITIWHNPRCSKSRETLALLQARGLRPEVRLYLADGPTLAELKEALARLGLPARALARTADPAFRDLGLDPDADDEAILGALAANPALIERPLVLANGRAALGRPPEAVLAILPG